jgi:hypothetical protein
MRPCLLCLAGLAVAAWPCPARAQYEWRPFPDTIDQVALYQHGRQVGAYHLVEDYYRPLDPLTRRWGERCKPPVEPPRRNFGLVQEQIRAGDHYSLNGREVSREQVQQVLGDGDKKVPDDSKKLRLTVIGDKAWQSVVDDVSRTEALAPWRDKVVAAWYPPDHWAVMRQGFRTDGRPTIYVQAPDGTVLHRQDDYRGGAAELAEVLRKLDPSYRPDKDRDRRKPDLLGGLLPRVPWSVPAVLLGAAALLVIFRRKP